jgi:hypothetical protein
MINDVSSTAKFLRVRLGRNVEGSGRNLTAFAQTKKTKSQIQVTLTYFNEFLSISRLFRLGFWFGFEPGM